MEGMIGTAGRSARVSPRPSVYAQVAGLPMAIDLPDLSFLVGLDALRLPEIVRQALDDADAEVAEGISRSLAFHRPGAEGHIQTVVVEILPR